MFRGKEDDRDERYVRYSGAKDLWPSEHPTKTTKPAFEDTETRIVEMAGRDVTLPCLVKNLNDKVVSSLCHTSNSRLINSCMRTPKGSAVTILSGPSLLLCNL
ncbi:hypothetical protein RUM44_005862 [Polyplax serrata]|uniref:Ig-like domain-containing protein n=1 Tax=Polyplax serrata TaxID=468196 RepID=A0ABR1AYA0_POLSC